MEFLILKMGSLSVFNKCSNKAINLTVFPLRLLCFKIAQKSPLQNCKLWQRYERGSKINRTSHVLNLRHVVAGLSALKYVGSLYLTSFVPGAK